jgi:hypothetical protein
MPWTVLRPSFRSCQVEPLTCTICCALPNSHLRAGCQFLRCRIRICVQAANSCAAEFASACRLPLPTLPNSAIAPILVNLSSWRGLDSPSSSPCSSTICATDFPLTNLQPHKSALPISPTDGMAASTLRPCFGQPAEACTSCTFDTVTATLAWLGGVNGLIVSVAWHVCHLFFFDF